MCCSTTQVVASHSCHPLRDHYSTDTHSPLCKHIPDPTLLRTLRSPPATDSSEVTEWQHELSHLHSSPCTEYAYVSSPKEYSPSLACGPLDMHLTLDEGAAPSHFEVAHTSHSRTNGLPVGLSATLGHGVIISRALLSCFLSKSE